MSDNKKYYYLKLKEDFFDSEEMKVLESMPNGIEYQNVYLKMCLLSLKSDGALMFKNMIPYSAEMLSSVLRINIDTIRAAISLFAKMELITITDTETIYMSDIQALVGQSSTEAERIKKYRQSLKSKEAEEALPEPESEECTDGVQMYEKCTPENRDKRLEIRVKNSKSHCDDVSSSQKSEPKTRPKKQSFPKEYYSKVIDIYSKNYMKLYHEIPAIDYKAISSLLKQRFETFGYESVLKAVTQSINHKWLVETAGYSFQTVLSSKILTDLINGNFEQKKTTSHKRFDGTSMPDFVKDYLGVANG